MSIGVVLCLKITLLTDFVWCLAGRYGFRPPKLGVDSADRQGACKTSSTIMHAYLPHDKTI